MKIPATLKTIIQCWEKAESNLRRNIKKKYRDPDEEFITRLFCGEFSFSLRKASMQGLIRKSFLEDLRRAYPELGHCRELTLIAENLIADVSLHKRHIEKFTGGDFGLTITRPDLSFSAPSHYSNTGYLEINANYQRGLLCQAKLKQKSGWGKLTPKQKKVLPERMPYLGLLLYECNSEERQLLKRFAWQMCSLGTVETINDWLKSGKFPSSASSSEIIQQLGNAKIGTDDERILDHIIRPTGKPQFSIKIYWASAKPPPKSVPIMLYSSLTNHVEEHQKVHVLVTRC